VLGRRFQVTRLLGARATDALAREALPCHSAAEVWRLDRGSEDRGSPSRWLETAAGGPALRAFYTATAVAALLRRLTGTAWRPSGAGGSYSYYRREGHFLGLHRDVEQCDLALITCVYEHGAPAAGQSGALHLWPERTQERLGEIAADPEPGRVSVRLRPGESIILLGGIVPHTLAEIEKGHVRIAAPLCFRPARPSGGTSAPV
jgi:hypothetical protein